MMAKSQNAFRRAALRRSKTAVLFCHIFIAINHYNDDRMMISRCFSSSRDTIKRRQSERGRAACRPAVTAPVLIRAVLVPPGALSGPRVPVLPAPVLPVPARRIPPVRAADPPGPAGPASILRPAIAACPSSAALPRPDRTAARFRGRRLLPSRRDGPGPTSRWAS